jgi:hypothetical protein
VAYRQAEELVYRRRDVDLSAFRFHLEQVYHVAVLGKVPPAEVAHAVERILAAGEPATLPPEVLTQLVQRRAQMSRTAPWIEGHYQPGKRL